MNDWPAARPHRSNPPAGTIGIVLPIRDDLRIFKLAYHSILSFTDRRFMLTIVDNMSSIATCQYIDSIRKNHQINTLHHQKDNSLGAIWNLGVRFMFSYSTVWYAVVLTPTFVVEPFWLSRLARFLDKHQVVAPKSDGGLDHALAFTREFYDELGGFNETADPVIDIATKRQILTPPNVYMHKFIINGFDPRPEPSRAGRENQEALNASNSRP